MFPERLHDRRSFHEVRPRSDDVKDVHIRILIASCRPSNRLR
jgi:hypothetical protein